MTTSNDRLVRKLVAGGVIGVAFGVGAAWVIHSRVDKDSEALTVVEGEGAREPVSLRADEVLRFGFSLFTVVRQAIDLVSKA